MKRSQESVHRWFGGFVVSGAHAPPVLLLTMHEFYFQIHLMGQHAAGVPTITSAIQAVGRKKE